MTATVLECGSLVPLYRTRDWHRSVPPKANQKPCASQSDAKIGLFRSEVVNCLPLKFMRTAVLSKREIQMYGSVMGFLRMVSLRTYYEQICLAEKMLGLEIW